MSNRPTAVEVLILLEPDEAHTDGCKGHKDPAKCNCYLLKNAKIRAVALENAGWKNTRREY